MKKMYSNSLPIITAFTAALLVLMTGCAEKPQSQDTAVPHENAAAVDATVAKSSATAEKEIPKLLDLGAHKCIPCKMMAPILEELTKDYQGRMEVEFIDVWQNPAAGQKYGVRAIPTQIFYGSDGRELFRHEGFYSKEDILAKWAEFGYTFPENNKEQ